MSITNEDVLQLVFGEVVRKNPLPWYITGDGPYHVISSDHRTIAKNLPPEQAEAIVKYALDHRQ